jgi:hypothetical protein
VVAAAVLPSVPRGQVRVGRDAELRRCVGDRYCDEVRIAPHHRGDRPVLRVIPHLLHVGALAEHGGIVVVVVSHVDRDRDVLLQDGAVEILVTLAAHLVHLISHDRHALAVKTLHQVWR